MNKRQRKKHLKKVNDRIAYLNQYNIVFGRKNGKTVFYRQILKAIYSKKYKPFINIKTMLERYVLL